MTTSEPPAGLDELERLFHRLVLNVADLDPARLDGPIPLVEIHQNLVPYRTHRTLLGIESSQDYEMTILRLLAGERGLARVEPAEVQAILAREAQSVNPETGVFRRFPSATAHLEPDRVREVLGTAAPYVDETAAAADQAPERPEPAPYLPPAIFAIAGQGAGDEEDAPAAQAELPFSLEDDGEEVEAPVGRDVRVEGAQCGYCGGELPVGRMVIFCPNCGQNVGVVHCPSCGTDLDVGWRFCITCGREMAGLG